MQAIIDKDFGINATIHIACDDEKELYQHLSVLRRQIKKAFGKNPDFKHEDFTDNNCYGTHEAIVEQDV